MIQNGSAFQHPFTLTYPAHLAKARAFAMRLQFR